MLAVHGGFAPALVGTLRPPPVRKALRITPTGGGTGDGSSWADAGTLANLNAFIAAAALVGAEVWLRADAGVYSRPTVLTISNGGVTVRGVDVNGIDAFAEIVGNRPVPWTAAGAYGNEMIRLNAGADDLTFRNLRFRNVGSACIRIREPISNLTIDGFEAFNVGRGIANFSSNLATVDASITGLTIRNLLIGGFSQHGILLQHNTTDVLIEDGVLDSLDTEGEFYTCGINIDQRASNGLMRRLEIRNILNRGPGSYWQGDGIAGSWNNANWTIEDCEFRNISDGGVDHKGYNLVIRGCTFINCKRSMRLWWKALAENNHSEEPRTRGDNQSKCHIFVMQGGRANVTVKGGTYLQAGAGAIFRGDDHSLIAWDRAALDGITAGAGYQVYRSEADDPTDSLSGLWDHSDVTPPTITGSTHWTVNENLATTRRVSISENAVLEKRGPDAAKITITGRDLAFPSFDFEAAGGAAADGTNVLKFELRPVDPSGNAGAWQAATITVADVADDPITPAETIALTGATDGYWHELNQPGALWADEAMTIPAIEGARAKVMADLFGFGRHTVFPDGREPEVVVLNGFTGLRFDGTNYGLLGPVGGMRHAQFTQFAVVNRDKEAGNGTFTMFWTGRRGKLSSTSDNSATRLAFFDTRGVGFRVNPNSSQSVYEAPSGFAAAPTGRTLVVSHRSTDGTLRTGHDLNGMVLRLDSTNTATASYVYTDEQPLIGARLDYAGVYQDFFEGIYFGGARINVAVPDDVRDRIEKQLGNAGGRL